MKRQKGAAGFTLIELVVVIVILGILAATALPRFVNMQDGARAAALQGVVGAINSASAVNYAGRLVSGSAGAVTANVTCDVAAGRILQGGVPNGYAVTTAITTGAANGASTDCTVTQTDGGATASATIISIL